MKFKIVGTVLVLIVVGTLAFLAAVAGVDEKPQAQSKPTYTPSKPRPSSGGLDALK